MAISYAIDISGNPYAKTIIGSVSFDTKTFSKMWKDFEKTFPNYTKKKGRDLDRRDLKRIIEFLDFWKVHMCSVEFGERQWEYFKRMLKDKSAPKERIIGILYFKLLQKFSKKGYTYSVVFDDDSFIDVRKAIRFCQRLADANKYSYRPTIGFAKTSKEIKFADFVASAHRKIRKKTLQQIKHFSIVNSHITKRELDGTFM